MFKKKSTRIFGFGAVAGGGKGPSHFLPGLFFALIISLAGCQTVPTLPPVNLSETGWVLRQGQVVWSAGGRAPEIAGDLVVATNAQGRAFVQFTKPPVPFLVAQSTGNSWELHLVP